MLWFSKQMKQQHYVQDNNFYNKLNVANKWEMCIAWNILQLQKIISTCIWNSSY